MRVVEGFEDIVRVAGRLVGEITSEVDEALARLPMDVLRAYNLDIAKGRSVDYVSKPTVQMPDEFDYFIDVESLDRVERETIVRMVSQGTRVWQAGNVPVAELWVGGRGQFLDRGEQEALFAATRELWSLPIQGRTFLLGEDVHGMRRRAFAEAIHEAGGVVVQDLDLGVDYYVTDLIEHVAVTPSTRVFSSFDLSILLDRE